MKCVYSLCALPSCSPPANHFDTIEVRGLRFRAQARVYILIIKCQDFSDPPIKDMVNPIDLKFEIKPDQYWGRGKSNKTIYMYIITTIMYKSDNGYENAISI